MLARTSYLTGRFFGWTEDNYWFAVFGTPSASEVWAWQFGGHHLAVNVTVHGERMFLTPTFLGVEPATYEDAGASYAPMRAERDRGLALLMALDPAHRAVTTVADRPREVYAGAGRDDGLPPLEGSRTGDWSPEQQQRLLEIVRGWVGLLPAEAAEARLDEIAADLDGSGNIKRDLVAT